MLAFGSHLSVHTCRDDASTANCVGNTICNKIIVTKSQFNANYCATATYVGWLLNNVAMYCACIEPFLHWLDFFRALIMEMDK